MDVWLPKQSISLINWKRESQQNLSFEGEQAHQTKSLHIIDPRGAEEFVWLRFHDHTSSSGVDLSHGNGDTFPRPKYKVTETAPDNRRDKGNKQQTVELLIAVSVSPQRDVLPVQLDMFNTHSFLVTQLTCAHRNDVLTCLSIQLLACPYMDIRMTTSH